MIPSREPYAHRRQVLAGIARRGVCCYCRSPRPSEMSHRLSQGDIAMGYEHAERNLALIRQLEA
jgi:hypothetical protein